MRKTHTEREREREKAYFEDSKTYDAEDAAHDVGRIVHERLKGHERKLRGAEVLDPALN